MSRHDKLSTPILASLNHFMSSSAPTPITQPKPTDTWRGKTATQNPLAGRLGNNLHFPRPGPSSFPHQNGMSGRNMFFPTRNKRQKRDHPTPSSFAEPNPSQVKHSVMDVEVEDTGVLLFRSDSPDELDLISKRHVPDGPDTKKLALDHRRDTLGANMDAVRGELYNDPIEIDGDDHQPQFKFSRRSSQPPVGTVARTRQAYMQPKQTRLSEGNSRPPQKEGTQKAMKLREGGNKQQQSSQHWLGKPPPTASGAPFKPHTDLLSARTIPVSGSRQASTRSNRPPPEIPVQEIYFGAHFFTSVKDGPIIASIGPKTLKFRLQSLENPETSKTVLVNLVDGLQSIQAYRPISRQFEADDCAIVIQTTGQPLGGDWREVCPTFQIGNQVTGGIAFTADSSDPRISERAWLSFIECLKNDAGGCDFSTNKKHYPFFTMGAQRLILERESSPPPPSRPPLRHQNNKRKRSPDLYSALSASKYPPLPVPIQPPTTSSYFRSKEKTPEHPAPLNTIPSSEPPTVTLRRSARHAPLEEGLRVNLEEVILCYPPGATGAVNITNGDMLRLEEGEFLNDTLLEFSLKLWLKDLKDTNPELADQVHVFSSFFYKKLCHKDFEKGYESVKKWTARIDLFAKRYVIVPINENLHWWLAIIYMPGRTLQTSTDTVAPPRRRSGRHSGGWDTSAVGSPPSGTGDEEEYPDESETATLLYPSRGKDHDMVDSILASQQTDKVDVEELAKETSSLSVNQQDGEPTALDEDADMYASSTPASPGHQPEVTTISDTESEPMLPLARTPPPRTPFERTKRTSISIFDDSLEIDGESQEGGGGEAAMDVDDDDDEVISVSIPDARHQPDPEVIEVEEAPIRRSGADPAAFYARTASNPRPRVRQRMEPDAEAAKDDDDDEKEVAVSVDVDLGERADLSRAVEIVSSSASTEQSLTDIQTKPWILTLDSLGGKHPKAGKVLSDYLIAEAKDKKGFQFATRARCKHAPVPTQPDYFNCGIYVLHFTKEFMENPEEHFSKIMSYKGTVPRQVREEQWKDHLVVGIRQDLKRRIESLSEKWKKDREEKVKEEEKKRTEGDVSGGDELKEKEREREREGDSDSDIELIGLTKAPSPVKRGGARARGKGKGRAKTDGVDTPTTKGKGKGKAKTSEDSSEKISRLR